MVHPLLDSRGWRSSAARLATAIAASAALAGGALPAAAVPVMPGAPAHGWLFDEGAGSAAAGAWGGHDATLQGGAGFSAATPFAYAGNHALALDGVDDFADVPSLAGVALEGRTAFTLSLWIRAAATPADRAFFAGTSPSGSDTFGGRYDSVGWLPGNTGTTSLMKLGLMIDGTNYQYEASSGIQQTTWQHVMWTWESGSGMRLYVDGVLDTPSATSPGLDTVVGTLTGQSRFLIGDGAKASWAGEIDELLLWQTALDGDHAEWLAANTGGALPIPEPTPATLVLLGLAGLALCARRDASGGGQVRAAAWRSAKDFSRQSA